MENYIGQIIAVAFSYAPQGWVLCDGGLLRINQFTALYSLLGTMYGGDGQTTFAVPDLRGRTMVCMGQGAGTSNYPLGQIMGAENVTLTTSQMPAHTHGFIVDATPGSTAAPLGGNLAQVNDGTGGTLSSFTTGTPAAPSALSTGSVQSAGGGSGVSVLQPLMAMNFIIATQGIYPPRP